MKPAEVVSSANANINRSTALTPLQARFLAFPNLHRVHSHTRYVKALTIARDLLDRTSHRQTRDRPAPTHLHTAFLAGSSSLDAPLRDREFAAGSSVFPHHGH